jgi:hypothetical protein
MTQWFRSSKIRVLLASKRIHALQPLVELADTELDTQISRTPELNDGVPHPSYFEEEAISAQLSLETQSAMMASAIPHNPGCFRILRKVKFQQRTLEPYSRSRTNGLVEYPHAKGGHPAVGYIHQIFRYSDESGLTTTLACIAQCSEVEDQFLDNSLDLGARLCGRDVQRHVLVPAYLLAHVVRFPWSTTSQLVISIHDYNDDGSGDYKEADTEMELLPDDL